MYQAPAPRRQIGAALRNSNQPQAYWQTRSQPQTQARFNDIASNQGLQLPAQSQVRFNDIASNQGLQAPQEPDAAMFGKPPSPSTQQSLAGQMPFQGPQNVASVGSNVAAQGPWSSPIAPAAGWPKPALPQPPAAGTLPFQSPQNVAHIPGQPQSVPLISGTQSAVQQNQLMNAGRVAAAQNPAAFARGGFAGTSPAASAMAAGQAGNALLQGAGAANQAGLQNQLFNAGQSLGNQQNNLADFLGQAGNLAAQNQANLGFQQAANQAGLQGILAAQQGMGAQNQQDIGNQQWWANQGLGWQNASLADFLGQGMNLADLNQANLGYQQGANRAGLGAILSQLGGIGAQNNVDLGENAFWAGQNLGGQQLGQWNTLQGAGTLMNLLGGFLR